MSCQQAPRFLTNCNALTSATYEDPYEFTETTSISPSIPHNAQKSRSKLTDLQNIATTVGKVKLNPHQQQQQLKQQKKLPLAQLNGKIGVAKAQVSPTATVKAVSAASPKTATSLKNDTLPQHQQSKKATNVCIVRPQQQQQQQQQQNRQRLQKQTELQPLALQATAAAAAAAATTASAASLTPIQSPSLYQHTPSLWQTPLILDTAPPVVKSSSSAPASPAPPMTANSISTTVSSEVVPPTSNTTVMAMVAPIVMQPPSAQTLPPSKFHHTTLAQHLQKVECLKKPRRTTPTEAVDDVRSAELPPLQGFEVAAKHSDSPDLNEIPVNVIFRMSLVGGDGKGKGKGNGDNVDSVFESASNVEVCPSGSSATAPNKSLATVPCSQATVLGSPLFSNSKQHSTSSTSPLLQNVKMERNLQAGSSVLHTSNALLRSSPKSTSKRKASNMKVALNDVTITASATAPANVAQKKIRKSIGRHLSFEPAAMLAMCSNTNAVAVVKMSQAELDADTTQLATASVLPYCLQKHWVDVYDVRTAGGIEVDASVSLAAVTGTAAREERIALHKQQLRRQAMQYLTTRSLQRLPFYGFRRRLLCVDRLLRKYQNRSEKTPPASIKQCCISGCEGETLEMASHCQQHIVYNAAQHVFLPCTAKFADNTQCRIPVFDITHDLPLCAEHARKRDAYDRYVCEQRPRKSLVTSATSVRAEPTLLTSDVVQPVQQVQQQEQRRQLSQIVYNNNRVAQAATPGRKRKVIVTNPAGRPQKRVKTLTVSPPPPPLSAVLQRKSSTTSLESIASNSHHSSSSSATHQKHYLTSPLSSLGAPPALAPLSGGNVTPPNMYSFGSDQMKTSPNMSRIGNQFAMVPKNNANANAGNVAMNFFSTNSDSNFASSGMGSSSSLPSTDDFLSQDMLSICENSSASSEDTGLGGFSDAELMLGGATDADDMPLGDTRLLEEHDLANVLNSLPEDAFKELFTAVHQEEREEVERALELADKHLKTLQQTIGSESDFIGDFLDVNDEILADTTDICSGTTAGIIDTSSLFIDSGSSSATTVTPPTNCTAITDIRGLVQT